MGRVEQDQGDGNISGKTIQTAHFDNEEDKGLQISFDSTINPTVKLETGRLGPNYIDETFRRIEHFDVHEREMKNRGDLNENECNDSDQLSNKRPKLNERYQEYQHFDNHPYIGG